MKPHQLEYLKKMHAGEGTWLRDAEIDSLFVEIERQRALIERAKVFAQVVERDNPRSSAFYQDASKWLKDAGERGGK